MSLGRRRPARSKVRVSRPVRLVAVCLTPRPCASDAEVRSNMLKSLLVNLLSLASVYFFDLLLRPLTHEHEHWLRRNVGWVYQALWLFPVVGLSLYLNVRRVPSPSRPARPCVHPVR